MVGDLPDAEGHWLILRQRNTASCSRVGSPRSSDKLPDGNRVAGLSELLSERGGQISRSVPSDRLPVCTVRNRAVRGDGLSGAQTSPIKFAAPAITGSMSFGELELQGISLSLNNVEIR